MIYCERCGHAMVEKPSGSYSRADGKKIMKLRCTYIFCPTSETIPEILAISAIILLVGLAVWMILN